MLPGEDRFAAPPHPMRSLRLGLLLPAVLLGCQRSPVPNPQAVRQTIDAHNASIERWYLAGHVDSVVSVFAKDVWQLPPNMAPVVGRDSLRAFWTNAFRWGGWEFHLQAEDVVTNGSIAVERGRYTLKLDRKSTR